MKKYKLLIAFIFLSALILLTCDKPPVNPIIPEACFTADTLTCVLGDCQIEFDASCSNDAVYFSWDFDGDGITDEEGGTKEVVTYNFDAIGDFSVKLTVKSEDEVEDTLEKIITVNELQPEACFTTDRNECEVDDCRITFDATCSQNAVHYQWDFDGNGTIDAEGSDKQVVEHTYSSAGTFSAKLTVEDGDGDESSYTEQITVTVSSSACELRLYQGHNQSGFLNQALPGKIRIRVFDGLNEPRSGIQVNFAVLTGGGVITQADVTDGEGVAEASWTLGNECGEQMVKAWVEDENCDAGILEISGFADKIYYEGEEYPVVNIGGQCWMAKNLNVGNFVLTPLAQQDNNIAEKTCSVSNEDNCGVFGGLYAWNEVMNYRTAEGSKGLCPDGWHVPTKNEWEVLVNFLGGPDVAGGKMKAVDPLWEEPNEGATNESGFSALPGGKSFLSISSGWSWGLGAIAVFGSSTKGNPSINKYFYLELSASSHSSSLRELLSDNIGFSASCRCIQD